MINPQLIPTLGRKSATHTKYYRGKNDPKLYKRVYIVYNVIYVYNVYTLYICYALL